jgi:hypothetical protein
MPPSQGLQGFPREKKKKKKKMRGRPRSNSVARAACAKNSAALNTDDELYAAVAPYLVLSAAVSWYLPATSSTIGLRWASASPH